MFHLLIECRGQKRGDYDHPFVGGDPNHIFKYGDVVRFQFPDGYETQPVQVYGGCENIMGGRNMVSVNLMLHGMNLCLPFDELAAAGVKIALME